MTDLIDQFQRTIGSWPETAFLKKCIRGDTRSTVDSILAHHIVAMGTNPITSCVVPEEVSEVNLRRCLELLKAGLKVLIEPI